MQLPARLRVERAVFSYDFWLDVHGVRAPRRRDLRRELRANLVEAAERHGATKAVARLGSTRDMAREATPADRGRPRWRAGLAVGAAVAATVLLVEFLAALAWSDGAMAASPDERVTGSMTLFPGSALEHVPAGAGFAIAFQPGWLCLAAGAVALLLTARPWRLRHRASGPGARAGEAAGPSVS